MIDLLRVEIMKFLDFQLFMNMLSFERGIIQGNSRFYLYDNKTGGVTHISDLSREQKICQKYRNRTKRLSNG